MCGHKFSCCVPGTYIFIDMRSMLMHFGKSTPYAFMAQVCSEYSLHCVASLSFILCIWGIHVSCFPPYLPFVTCTLSLRICSLVLGMFFCISSCLVQHPSLYAELRGCGTSCLINLWDLSMARLCSAPPSDGMTNK